MTKYYQRPFDKGFIRAVEYLYEHRDKHGKFRSRKELLYRLHILESNYSLIKKGERGVPRHMYTEIQKFLKDEFGVNPGIFESNQGSEGEVLLKRFKHLYESNSKQEVQHEPDNIELLNQENAALKSKIEEQNKRIDSLLEDNEFLMKYVIEKLKGQG